MSKTRLGIDVLLEKHLSLLKNKRVAFLGHAASLSANRTPTLTLLSNHPNIQLVKLFGPEHGLYSAAQDMQTVQSSQDPLTGLEVISLYGDTIDSLKPKKSDLKDVDVLVCDLQDIGVRYYTYIYTLALCMQVCAEMKIEVVVLDRPNPLNGTTIEGNLLDKNYASFVGFYELPVRHGMTIGELAKYFNTEEKIGCALTVVPMERWNPAHYFDETGLAWVNPSPNMPSLETAVVYPGGCLIEATELSEGRGTDTPFEILGAPYIHADELAQILNNLRLGFVRFEACHFTPRFQKHAGKICHGVRLHVSDRKKFSSYVTSLKVIQVIRDLYPGDFSWRHKPYEFVSDIPAIDLLTGCSEFRKLIETKASLDPWIESWKKKSTAFVKKRERYLMYDR